MSKKMVRGVVYLSIIAVLLILAGCAGGTDISKSDRLNEFISDANASNYSGMTGNVHPDAGNYNQLDATYWENYFPSNEDYTVDVSFSGDSASGTITSSSTTEYNGDSITIDFKNDPESSGGLFGGENDNWKILRLVIESTTIVQGP